MTLNPVNKITREEAEKLGIFQPAEKITVRDSGDVSYTPKNSARKLKPPALSVDSRRPWLDNILKRFKFCGKTETEDDISAELADRVALAELEGRSRCIAHHVANEGKRSKAAGALAKYIGMFPGAQDWWFMGASWGGGVIELKVDDEAADPVKLLSRNQKDHRAWCLHHGVRHAVCTSADEAWKTLIRWGAFVE